MVTICGRPVFGDVTNLIQAESPHCPMKIAKSTAGKSVTKGVKSPLEAIFRTEQIEDMLEEKCATDEILHNMRISEGKNMWAAGRSSKELSTDVEAGLPLGAPARSAAVWMLGRLAEHVQLPESHHLDAMLVLDMYCLHRPGALECTNLAALCAAITRLVKKTEDALPTEELASVPMEACRLAQWLHSSGYPHLETWITHQDVNQQEHAVLTALGWNLKMSTVQDWLTVVFARLNVFTRSRLVHLLTPLQQYNFQFARLLAAHCPTTAACGANRIAQGLLCLGLVSAHILPADTFGLVELAAPAWEGAAQQCRPESLAFLLDGLEAATGSDVATLRADTHLVNETLFNLRSSGS